MKAIVLSSGGVDSTTCVSMAVEKHGAKNVATVTIYYGQKLDTEIACARKVAEYYGLEHYEFDVSEVFKYSQCSLLKTGQDVVLGSYDEQADGGIITSYVPFRNGLFLSVCAVLACSIYPDEECEIYLGNHASDYAYADCSVSFVDKMSAAIQEGTYGNVHFVAPLKDMTKAQVVATGAKLNTPYNLTWSCYKGGRAPCGACASCIERKRAFELNGLADPADSFATTLYKN